MIGPIHGFKWELSNREVIEEVTWTDESGEELFDEDTYLQTEIRAWCLDSKSQPCLFRFDFDPFVYVELPRHIFDAHGVRQVNWGKQLCTQLLDEIETTVKIVRTKYHKLPKLYYYNNDLKYSMLQIFFHSENDKFNLIKLLKNEIRFGAFRARLTVHEAHIPTITKMLTAVGLYTDEEYRFHHAASTTQLEQQLQEDPTNQELQDKLDKLKKDNSELRSPGLGYSQWFSIPATEVTGSKKISRYPEYIGDWRKIKPDYSTEATIRLSSPKILAFDIETASSRPGYHSNSTNPDDPVWIITVIFQVAQQPDTRRQFALLLGDCDTTHLKDYQLNCFDDEIDLIDYFQTLIQRLDPQIISGHNIFGFDFPYLNTRIHNRWHRWSPKLSCLLDSGDLSIFENSWTSGAYGKVSTNYVDIPGRIWLDTLPFVRNNVGLKLPDYKLETISQKFLGEGKHDVSYDEMYQIYRQMVQDPNDSKIQRRVRQVVDYGIQDSVLVIKILDKINAWAMLIQQSNVLSVDVMTIYTRGQQIKVLSQIYRYAARTNQHGIVLDTQSPADYPFYGGYVGHPIPGMQKCVGCFDFASLYPTIIMAYNISWDTLVLPQFWEDIPESACHIIKIDLREIQHDEPEESPDLLDQQVAPENVRQVNSTEQLEVRFIRQEIYEGILPRMVKTLVKERRAVRARIADYTDPVIQGILDQLQLALKVSANSGYGILGVKNGGLLSLLEGSIAVTYLGRQSILRVNDILVGKTGDVLPKTVATLQEKYPQIEEFLSKRTIVYNDTDSSFIQYSLTNDMVMLLEIFKTIEHHINGLNPEGEPYFLYPMKLEFEKYFWIILLIKPKMYVGVLCATGDNPKKGIIKGQPLWNQSDWFLRGVALVRRDRTPLVKEVYRQLIQNSLEEQPWYIAADQIREYLDQIRLGEIDVKKFLKTGSIKHEYKENSTTCMKAARKYFDDHKIPYTIEERFYFLVARSNDPQAKVGDKIRPFDYFESVRGTTQAEEIDYGYYIQSLQKVIDEIFGILYQIDFQPVKDYIYRHFKGKALPIRQTCIIEEEQYQPLTI